MTNAPLPAFPVSGGPYVNVLVIGSNMFVVVVPVPAVALPVELPRTITNLPS